jgi:hypothetical protein
MAPPRHSGLFSIGDPQPVVDLDRFERIWQQVAAHSGTYTMNP